MAIPTISSVSPSTIWTGGQVIVITGTNFRLPVDPPAANGPLPDPIPSVEVLVDGVLATDVFVLSATQVACQAPEHDPGVISPGGTVPAAVGVTVRNLDDAGVAITGETATLASAITYVRPDLTVEGDAGRVERTLIKMLKRKLVDLVVKSTAPDYGEYPFEVTPLPGYPCLVLAGPDVSEDIPYGTNSKTRVATGAGTFDQKRPPNTKRLDYGITGYTKGGSQCISLMTLTEQVLRRSHHLAVPRSKTDPAAGDIRYPLEVPYSATFRDTSTPNKDGIHSFTGSFSIRGVLLEDLTSFPNESIVDKGLADQDTFEIALQVKA